MCVCVRAGVCQMKNVSCCSADIMLRDLCRCLCHMMTQHCKYEYKITHYILVFKTIEKEQV